MVEMGVAGYSSPAMHRASKAGALPQDSDASLAGHPLPKGRRVVPDPEGKGPLPGAAPVLWVAEKPSKDLAPDLAALVAAFPETGLWPLALDGLDGQADRPWLVGELDPSMASSPEGHDAGVVLKGWWAAGFPMEDEEGEEAYSPFGAAFPGLALGAAGADESEVDFADVEIDGRLGLVSVTRPADVPAALGWLGPINAFDDMGPLSAVLRSWEDRFGAFVIGMGFDTLMLYVAHPPKTAREALAIAAEHAAVCSDNIQQGAGSIEAYAEELLENPVWSFWWD